VLKLRKPKCKQNKTNWSVFAQKVFNRKQFATLKII